MSDYTVYDSGEELHEHLSDVQELLDDFKKTEQALEEQRGVLADQVQGATVILEKQVSDYEQKRDDLDRRQSELIEQRQPFIKARDRLQQQIDAKQDAKQGKSTAALEESNSNEKKSNPTQGDVSQKTGGPVTKADIEKLKEQISKPKLDLTLAPPGGISQASTIDKDLKLMADIRAKEEKLDNASQNLRENWNRSSGPKR